MCQGPEAEMVMGKWDIGSGMCSVQLVCITHLLNKHVLRSHLVQ